MTPDASQPPVLSWDSERSETPARPPKTSSFTPGELIHRPRRVAFAFALVLAASLICVTVTALAITRVEELRATLTSLIPADLSDEYSEAAIHRAVNVFLGTVGGLGLVLAIVQALCAVRLLGRSSASRVVLILTVLLGIPVAFVAASLRDAGTIDLVASFATLLAQGAAIVLVLTPRVSAWLRQDETPRKQKLLGPNTSADE